MLSVKVLVPEWEYSMQVCACKFICYQKTVSSCLFNNAEITADSKSVKFGNVHA